MWSVPRVVTFPYILGCCVKCSTCRDVSMFIRLLYEMLHVSWRFHVYYALVWDAPCVSWCSWIRYITHCHSQKVLHVWALSQNVCTLQLKFRRFFIYWNYTCAVKFWCQSSSSSSSSSSCARRRKLRRRIAVGSRFPLMYNTAVTECTLLACEYLNTICRTMPYYINWLTTDNVAG
jgi:hypothetical protein